MIRSTEMIEIQKAQFTRSRRKRHLAPKRLSYILGFTCVVAVVGIIGAKLNHVSYAQNTAPTSPTAQICGNSTYLQSPYDYSGSVPSGTLTPYTSGTAELPTFGSADSDFPSDTAGYIVPAGNDSGFLSANYNFMPNTVYWLAPGTHTFSGAYGAMDLRTGNADDDSIVGGYSPTEGEAIMDGSSTQTSAFDDDATSVNIEYLTIQNFATGTDSTVVNHDGGSGWTIKYDTVQDNDGGGVGLGDNDVISDNCLTNNQQYGFNSSGSGTDSNVTLTNNEISYNDAGGLYDQESYVASYTVSNDVATIVTKAPLYLAAGTQILVGITGQCSLSWCANLSDTALDGTQTIASVISDNSFTFDVNASNVATTSDPSGTVASYNSQEGAAGGGKFWEVNGATVTGNWVHDNGFSGLWADTDNVGLNISDNYIDNNWAEGIIYEASYNASITDNTFINNAWGGGPSPGLGGFPDGAIYISESGSDSRVSSTYGSTFAVTGNTFTNNWGGVVIYENSNRACGISNDQLCTLVDPTVYTLTSCGDNIPNGSTTDTPDYVDNCRWKSQNVSVSDNTFSFTASDIGADCTVSTDCGFNGLFSEPGTQPTTTYDGAWPVDASYPYANYVVPNNISNNQNNSFSENTYCGSWNFVGFAQGDNMTQVQWTSGVTNVLGTGDNFKAQDADSTFSTSCGLQPPTAGITSPSDDEPIHGNNVSVTTTGTPASGNTIVQSQLLIGSTVLQTLTSTPYTFAFNTLDYSDGSYILTCRVTDSDSNVGSAVGTVYITNGDLNGDGKVSLSDLIILAQNYGKSGTFTYSQGNITGATSGSEVNLSDLIILAKNYGYNDGLGH
jgi:hypothetical protein